MHYSILILSFGLILFFLGKFIKHKSLYPFMPFRYDFRKRRDSFRQAMKLLDEINAKVIVETGTSRQGLKAAKSNGAFTIVFGKWAKYNGAILHSVDISEKSIYHSQKEVDRQKLSDFVNIHHSDSVAYLNEFDEIVDFLYLDSYDYSDDVEEQIKSQNHHLEEFKAIENKLHKKSIVLIDDCDLPNGGKGKTVVKYMLNKNWKIFMQGYQILLVQNDLKI